MRDLNAVNRDYYGELQAQLQRLGVSEGQTYRTTPDNKVHIPAYNGSYGLNVLDPDREVAKKYLAMLSVQPQADKIVSRYYATGEEETAKFVRPGLVDKLGGIVLIELAEAGKFDGYQITATERGLVTVEGILPGMENVEALPAIAEHPYSASTFLQTVERALSRRESVTA